MVNKPHFGMVPQMGLMALGGAGNSAIQSGQTSDGHFDWGSSLSGLGGLAAGAGLGAYAGKYLSGSEARQKAANAQKIKDMNKKIKSAKTQNAKKALQAELKVLKTPAKGMIAGGKGKALTWLAKNPRSAMIGGAGLGGLIGATMLAKAVSGPRENLLAQQQQSYAQQDAQNQMRDMQLAYGNNGRSW